MNDFVEAQFLHFALLSQDFKKNVIIANELFPRVEPSPSDNVEVVVQNIPLGFVHPVEE